MAFPAECDIPGCGSHADVLGYEPGYPAPMIRACFDHLGALIKKDRKAPLSTPNYELVVCHPDHYATMPPLRM